MVSEPTSSIADEVGPRKTGSAGTMWDSVLFSVVCLLTLFARFRNPALLLGSYQDDFFYYLKVAQKIAATGSSTFNGINLTNGYHPLWMATLVVLCRLFHGTVFFVALQIVSLASALATYALMLRTLRFYLADAPARCGAFVLGMEALMLIRYGMEVTLTLPLAVLLIYLLLRRGMPGDFSSAAKLGAVASLLILSRLDAGLLVGLLCIALLLPPFRAVRTPKVLLGFVGGVAPLLLLYFAVNLHFFHLLTPVSGLAKQMKTGLSLSPETWEALRPSDRMRRIVLLPELLLIGTGLIAGLTRRSAAPADVLRTRLLWVLLLFPLLHLCTLSLLSDWTVWPWYFYSLTVAALAAYVLLVDRLPQTGTLVCASLYAGILVLYAAAYAWKGPNSVTVLQSSKQLAGYMDAHPGVYMMGDQAGTTGFLSHQPVIQTEGLVMDKHFLQLMKAKTPLSEIAVDYNAAYYAKIGGEYRGSCLYLAEPANAGPASPVMRGTICHAPLVVFYRTADNMPIRVFQASWIR